MWCRRSAADTYVRTEGCPYGKSYGEDTSSHSEGTFHESAFLSFRGRRARLTSSALEASVLVAHPPDPLFTVQYWYLARFVLVCREPMCVYARSGTCALRAYGVVRMCTHNNIPTRQT